MLRIRSLGTEFDLRWRLIKPVTEHRFALVTEFDLSRVVPYKLLDRVYLVSFQAIFVFLVYCLISLRLAET